MYEYVLFFYSSSHANGRFRNNADDEDDRLDVSDAIARERERQKRDRDRHGNSSKHHHSSDRTRYD